MPDNFSRDKRIYTGTACVDSCNFWGRKQEQREEKREGIITLKTKTKVNSGVGNQG
jgi:hypothetical protein